MKKKSPHKVPKGAMTLEKLASLMVDGFNDVQEQIGAIHGQMDSMQGQMDSMQGQIKSMQEQIKSMQEQIGSLQEQVTSIEVDIKSIKMELRTINERLDALEESVRDVRGYAKEIDDLRARVRKMELFLKQRGLSMV